MSEDPMELHSSDLELTEADRVLKAFMAGFGVERYVLVVVGEPCEHGKAGLELHAGGLSQEDLASVMVDLAASLNRLNVK